MSRKGVDNRFHKIRLTCSGNQQNIKAYGIAIPTTLVKQYKLLGKKYMWDIKKDGKLILHEQVNEKVIKEYRKIQYNYSNNKILQQKIDKMKKKKLNKLFKKLKNGK